MKPILFTIFIFLLACTPKTNVNTSISIANQDTILINNTVYNLDSISEKDFNTIEKSENTYIGNELIDDTSNVIRDNMKLTFHLKNGVDSVLVNDTTEDYAFYIKYTYLESLNNIDYWLVGFQFYEGGGYLLLSKENGKHIRIWSKPLFSPDKEHFICYSCDLEARYNPNGFQLFEVKNKEIALLWSKELKEWGPSEIRWKNDSMIYIEKLKMDFNDSKNPNKISYRSMKIE